MIDPRVFRDAEAYAAARARLQKRGENPVLAALLEELRERAEQRRRLISDGEVLQAEQNAKSKLVGEKKKKGEDASALLAELADLSQRASAAQSAAGSADEQFHGRLLGVPNLPADDLPVGDATHNAVVRSWGEVAAPAPWRKPHWDLAKDLGLLDLERGAKLSGSGFPLYVGLGARLERALITYLLRMQTDENGYTEVAPPFVVTRETMTGTGQLPKFEDDLYRIADDLFLIPTAEVPVTNMHRGEILQAAELPKRYAAYTPCFRREAGAAGADTRGILRVHQFDKVELVWFTAADASDAALEALTGHAELALQRLGLPYRVLKLATGDLGFGGYRTYDLETWAPGVGKWLEVSSCSSFSDFQARRLDVRYRPAGGGKPEFVHTLNGSSLGLARTWIAVVEHYQQPDGSIKVPEVLVPLMGVDHIGPRRA